MKLETKISKIIFFTKIIVVFNAKKYDNNKIIK